jgi:hypothetical protein
MSLDLSKSVITDTNGMVLLEATLKSVAESVEVYNASLVNDLETIGVAVHSVFDTYKGTSINKPALVSLTMAKLGGTDPNTFALLSERINGYVDSQVNAGVLNMRKGKGGGFSRASDQPVKA